MILLEQDFLSIEIVYNQHFFDDTQKPAQRQMFQQSTIFISHWHAMDSSCNYL